MGTSGTGHDLCPSLVSRAHQASGPSCGGNWKIIKTAFGFKGVAKNFRSFFGGGGMLSAMSLLSRGRRQLPQPDAP
jgi:hypothetical protein